MTLYKEIDVASTRTVIPPPADAFATLNLPQIRGGTDLVLDTYLAAPNLASLNEKHTSTRLRSDRDTQRQLRYISAFLRRPLQSQEQSFISSNNLSSELLRVTVHISRYLPNRDLRLKLNRDEHYDSHKIELWVQTTDAFREEVQALKQFDLDWWLTQESGLRESITVLLE